MSALSLAGLAACGAGAVGAAASLNDDGGDTPGAISGFDVQNPEVSPAQVVFRLTDAQGDAPTVTFYYKIQDQPARLMKHVASPGNPAQLGASAGGVEYSFDWDFPGEVGLPDDESFVDDVLVYALVKGGSPDPVIGTNADQTGMGNDAPVITFNPGDVGDEVSAIVVIPFTVKDSSGHLVDITVEYQIQDGPPDPEWLLARPVGEDCTPGTEGCDKQYAFENLFAPPEGVEVQFIWDTDEDLPTLEHLVKVRFTAQDPVAIGESTETESFTVDNNESPSVIILEAGLLLNGDRRRGIPIPFRVRDPEDDAVQIVFQWTPESEAFEDLPSDPEAIAEILADPELSLEYRIASEWPSYVRGRALPQDPLGTVRLPEVSVSGGASALFAHGVEGRTLELLRASCTPQGVADSWTSNPLEGPVAALPIDDGPTALVLDGSSSPTWRLMEVDLATGDVARFLVPSAPGSPSAMAYEAGGQTVLVASDLAGGGWQVSRVSLEDPAAVPEVLVGWDGTTERGAVRAILSLGSDAALVTLPSSLVHLDYRDPLAPRTSTVLAGLARPWGLVANPAIPNRVWMSEMGRLPRPLEGLGDPAAAWTTRGEGRVVALDLVTQATGHLLVAPIRGSSIRLARPRHLALEASGTRLLVITDDDPLDGTQELRAVKLGRGEESTVFEICGGLPEPVGAVSASEGGMRIVALPAVGDLAVGGGVTQRRTVTHYDPSTQEATVDGGFSPALVPSQSWRMPTSKIDAVPARPSQEGGTYAVFLWDSLDVPREEAVKFRATPIDSDVGAPVETEISLSVPAYPIWLDPPSPPLAEGLSIRGAAAGDLDRDGDLDLVVVGFLTNSLRTYIQERPGVFREGEVIMHDNMEGPSDIVLADLNQDGWLDLLSANQTSSNLTVYFQDPQTGSFERIPVVLSPKDEEQFPLDCSAADLDGDGDLDVVSANVASLTVFFQGLPGEFDSEPTELQGTLGAETAVTTGDVDADGDLDIVAYNHDFAVPGTVLVDVYLQADGDPGTFTLGAPIGDDGLITGGGGGESLILVDLTGDGHLDLLVGNTDQENVAIFVQRADGSFQLLRYLGDSSHLEERGRFTVADVDGDGDLDVVAANKGIAAFDLSVWFQTAPGEFGFSAGWDYALGELQSQAVVAADMDSDGHMDIVAAGNKLVVFQQKGPGHFAPDPPSLGGWADMKGPERAVAADLDGDGDLDLVTANKYSQNLTIHFQTLPTTFAPEPLVLGGPEDTGSPSDLVAADLDGDGDLDLATVDNPDDSLVLFLQTDPGAFDSKLVLTGGSKMKGIRGIAAGDLNDDGRIDLVSANFTTNTLAVFFQSATGAGFDEQDPPLILEDQEMLGPLAVAAADLNADGLLDVISSNFETSNLTIFNQTAPGVFDEALTLGEGFINSPRRFVVVDLEQDGDLDLVVANEIGDSLAVFFQSAPGAFDPIPLIIPIGNENGRPRPWDVDVADLDGDGDLDLVVANSGSNDLQVFLQTNPGQFSLRPLILTDPGTLVWPAAVLAEDLDGDGDVDVISVNRDSDTMTLFFRDHQ